MAEPSHPGKIVRSTCLKPLGLTITKAAKVLGISRVHLSNVINGHYSITAETAIRLEKAFGEPAAAWLDLQAKHDLAQARKYQHELVVNTDAM